MSQQDPLSITVESAAQYLLDPRPTAGELIGGVAGSAFGPVGSFVGGTIGRVFEKLLID